MDTIGRLYWRNRRQSGSKAIPRGKTGSRNASVIDKETRCLETKPEFWLDGQNVERWTWNSLTPRRSTTSYTTTFSSARARKWHDVGRSRPDEATVQGRCNDLNGPALHRSLGGGYASRNGNSNILARRMGVIHQVIPGLALLPSSPRASDVEICTNYYRDSAICLYLTCWRASD